MCQVLNCDQTANSRLRGGSLGTARLLSFQCLLTQLAHPEPKNNQSNGAVGGCDRDSPAPRHAMPELLSRAGASGPRSLTLSFPPFAPHLLPSLLCHPSLSLSTSVSSCLAAVPSPFTPSVPPAAVAVPRVAEPRGLGVPKHTHPVPPVATAAWRSRPPPASPVSLPTTLASSHRTPPTPSPLRPCLPTLPAR